MLAVHVWASIAEKNTGGASAGLWKASHEEAAAAGKLHAPIECGRESAMKERHI